MAAFVLVNAYCSTLISYLVSPRLMPVAKSMEDVASGSPQNLKLLAEKNELLHLYSLVLFFVFVFIKTVFVDIAEAKFFFFSFLLANYY